MTVGGYAGDVVAGLSAQRAHDLNLVPPTFGQHEQDLGTPSLPVPSPNNGFAGYGVGQENVQSSGPPTFQPQLWATTTSAGAQTPVLVIGNGYLQLIDLRVRQPKKGSATRRLLELIRSLRHASPPGALEASEERALVV